MMKTIRAALYFSLCMLSMMVMAGKDPKVLAVENYIKALNTKDIKIIESMYAKNATVEDPVGAPVKEGHAEVVKFYAEGAFKGEISAELTGPVRVAGDSAAFEFTVYFNGMKMEVIDVFEFNKDNQVVSMKAYWSNANISPMKK